MRDVCDRLVSAAAVNVYIGGICKCDKCIDRWYLQPRWVCIYIRRDANAQALRRSVQL